VISSETQTGEEMI